MRKFELTTWGRAWLSMALGSLSGATARDYRHAHRVLDVMELTESERKQVNWRETSPGRAEWDDVEKKWEISLDDNDAAWLASYMSSRPLPQGDTVQVVTLLDAIGVKGDE